MNYQHIDYHPKLGRAHYPLGIHHYRTRIYSELAGAPDKLKGHTIIHLSDLHIDPNNILSPDEFKRNEYGQYLHKILQYHDRDLNKTSLMITGDIVNTNSKTYLHDSSEETPFMYVEQVVPHLHSFPGAQKYITRGNHDHEHSDFTQMKNLFTREGFTDLTSHGNTISKQLTLGHHTVALIGLPDYKHQSDYYTTHMYEYLQDLTQSHDYSVIMIHNLDGLDGKRVKKLGNGFGLTTLRNCLILSGHTHRFHINLPPIGNLINQYSGLKFQSKYYHGHHELPNNNTLINNPGLGNSTGVPIRINATGGA